MFDLIIIGFACISIAAFVGSKDNKTKQNVIIEKIDETPT
tara:strand:- start:387 stop:506 length:120 start_codon:yes stop_codon:yes gene_type:complete